MRPDEPKVVGRKTHVGAGFAVGPKGEEGGRRRDASGAGEELKGMLKWEVWGRLICTSSQMSHDSNK